MKSSRGSKRETMSFVQKIYNILSKPKYSGIISWCEEGKNFQIHDQHLFTNIILPAYFKHINFSSFTKQLNKYGFNKTQENTLEFNHPLFQKNNETLLAKIRRKGAKPKIIKEKNSNFVSRLIEFQNQQNKMESFLENLEKQYNEIVEQNQALISGLIKSKKREKNIERFIENTKNNAEYDFGSDQEDFVRLSCLSYGE